MSSLNSRISFGGFLTHSSSSWFSLQSVNVLYNSQSSSWPGPPVSEASNFVNGAFQVNTRNSLKFGQLAQERWQILRVDELGEGFRVTEANHLLYGRRKETEEQRFQERQIPGQVIWMEGGCEVWTLSIRKQKSNIKMVNLSYKRSIWSSQMENRYSSRRS